MYKILGADQKEYGPVSADVLRQWIADRRANAQTLIQAEGSAEWKPLSQFPEFADALAAAGAAPRPGAGAIPGQPQAAVALPAGEQNKKLATTSLVLGMAGLTCLPFVASLAAIVTGHIAQTKAKRSPQEYGGAGLALAGLIMGYVSLALVPVIAILAGLMLPALAKAKGRAQSINCVSHLKQVGLAGRMWANDHNDVFPTSFLAMSNELVSPKVLTCPSDTGKVKALDWPQVTPQTTSYEMVSPGLKDDPASARTVFVRCPIHNHVCYGDGSVQQGRSR